MKSGGTGFQPVKEFRIYRRNLPHWERPESIYFITFRTFKQVIITEDSRNITFNSILFHNNEKYKLYAFVIMPDHVHLLLQPLEKTNDSFYSLSEILHSIKSYSANQINKIHKNTGKMPVPPRVMNYIINNPIKANLVESANDYKWLYILD